jgi:hypothetical protein
MPPHDGEQNGVGSPEGALPGQSYGTYDEVSMQHSHNFLTALQVHLSTLRSSTAQNLVVSRLMFVLDTLNNAGTQESSASALFRGRVL